MNKRKNAEIGWSFIVKLIIGLMLLFVLIIIAVAAKGGFSNFFAKVGEIFG